MLDVRGSSDSSNISGLHVDGLDADIRLLSQHKVLLSEAGQPQLKHINKTDLCPRRPTRLLSSAEKDMSLIQIINLESKLVVARFVRK